MSDLMNTRRLAEAREAPNDFELAVPIAELCARYEKLYTGAVNDVLRELCLPHQALPTEIAPLRDDMVVCGEAFTVRAVADPTMAGELETRVEMLDRVRPHHVCVWNANGERVASHWGGVMTRASMKRGCRGAIIDGGIRDTRDILDQRFPVWYRYRTSTGALSHTKIDAYQVPIVVEGVIVKPGDIVMADLDGALVIPRKIAVAVLERAEQIERNEGEIKEWVDAGLSAAEISDRGGYF
ncbi:MAG: RraA family protein [Planctomycetota bacterium]